MASHAWPSGGSARLSCDPGGSRHSFSPRFTASSTSSLLRSFLQCLPHSLPRSPPLSSSPAFLQLSLQPHAQPHLQPHAQQSPHAHSSAPLPVPCRPPPCTCPSPSHGPLRKRRRNQAPIATHLDRTQSMPCMHATLPPQDAPSGACRRVDVGQDGHACLSAPSHAWPSGSSARLSLDPGGDLDNVS